jgi:hypothetical protein
VTVGLILANDKGEASPVYSKTPIDRTALKTTSGTGGYSDFQHPYAPITQDDWSGGRGGLDYERDSTRFYDSNRVNTHRENKAFLGPGEHFSDGYKTIKYHFGERYTQFYRVTADAATVLTFTPAVMTLARLWLLVRKVGTPTDITLKLNDGASDVATVTLSAAAITDTLSQWIPLTINVAVTAIPYTLKVSGFTPDAANYIEFAQSAATKLGVRTAASACFVIETTAVDDDVIFYEYKGLQYMVLSTVGAAPKVFMNGDRGAADSNAGDLTKLKDATQTWAVNEHVGRTVKIVMGTGKLEKVQYRKITANLYNELTCDTPWVITHDTTTEYVILGADTWKEMTGHGLTVPVTSVVSVWEAVYFAQGDAVAMRSHREYNNSGVWTSQWRAETTAATFLAYLPLANKMWRAQNTDLAGNTSASVAPAQTYGTDLVFGASTYVGYKYDLINGVLVYPSDNGVESLWVYKEELPYVISAKAEGIELNEMKVARSRKNGAATLVWGVYSFFTLGNGLERYYGGGVEDLGPNIDEGLPIDRRGPIVSLLGYPGRFFAIIDGGENGYSALMERAGSGWHEVYRAPLGQRLKGMALQVIAGEAIDRLWLYQGNIVIWLPFANDATNELRDTAYTYALEGSLTLSRMHAGMFDVQKLIKMIKIWSDQLESGVSINVAYRLNNNTTWIPITGTLITSPVSLLDMTPVYGIAGQRIQLRIDLQSDDNTKTPILLAAIVEAVIRIQVKYMYNLTFRIADDEQCLSEGEMDDQSNTASGQSAMTKLKIIEDWSDASADSMLYMTSNSPLYDGKFIFINPPTARQIAVNPDTSLPWTGDAFICTTTVQEA